MHQKVVARNKMISFELISLIRFIIIIISVQMQPNYNLKIY